MFMPAVLRYGIGTDYPVYTAIFKDITRSPGERVEYGFYLLNMIFRTTGFDVQWVFGAMSFLTLFFLFRAIPRRSFYFITPFYYMMLYTASYNTVRQSLVICMAYYAYRLFEKRRIKRAFVCIAIAALFHRSAVMYFALFLLMLFLRIRKRTVIVVFCLILAMTKYINLIIGFMFQYIISYTVYANYIIYLQNNAVTNNEWFATISRYMIFIMLLLSMPKHMTKEMSDICILFLIYIFSYVLGQNILIFGRLSNGFSFAWFPIIHYINSHKAKYTKIVLAILLCWALVYFFFSLKNGMNGVLPYRSIIQR
ncbi:MAG: EpsG family protein [Dysgonamonadaceae bacterium]|nr:EpsG family protein [Dysgonamonadaceae bacterium]